MGKLRRKKKEEGDSQEKIKVDEAYWQRIKEIVDAVMDSTEEDRKQMTSNLEQFKGNIFNDENLKQEFGNTNGAQINLLFSTVENIAPMLSDNKPITSVVPHMPYMSKMAYSYNAYLKYVWETLDMQMNLYKAALSALLMKIAIFEVGMEQTEPKPFCRLVDPRNFGLLPGYDEIKHCPMVWVREPLPLSWVRKNFPDVQKVTPTSSIEDRADKVKAFKYGEAHDFELEAFFAVVYRVWMKDEQTLIDIIQKDKDGNELLDDQGNPKKQKKPAYPYGKWCYFTENEFLGAVACKERHGRPPFVEMKNYLVPFDFLGMDENMQLEGINKEINRQMQYAIDHAVRHHRPDLLVDTAVISDRDDIANNAGKGLGKVFFKQSSYDTRGVRAVEEIEHRPLDPSIFTLQEFFLKVQEEITGETAVSKGQVGKNERQSASEIGILAETAHTRTRQRVRNQDWTIENLSELFILMAQQHNIKDGYIWYRDEEDVKYEMFGSSKAKALEMFEDAIPDFEKVIAQWRNTEPGARSNVFAPEVVETIQDYEMFVQNFQDSDDLDPVYFDFSIEVQTNSTLPLDKQSMANLMMRLFQMKAIDVPLLLQTIQPPGWQEAIQRWEEAQEQKKNQPPPGGAGGPQRAPIPMTGGQRG